MKHFKVSFFSLCRPAISVLAVVFSSATVCFAGNPPTEANVAAAIESSKVLDASRRVRVSFSGNELCVSSFCDSNARDIDLKISALMILKTVMHDFAERLSVSRLRALFFDLRNPNEYREVVVKPAHVELLNRGAQPANLLTTVEVSRGSYNRTMTVSPGILLGERTKLRDLLLRLKRNGKDISDVAAKYSRLEQLVKSGAKRESISEVCNEAFLDASILTTQAQKKYAIPKRMTLRQNGLTFNYMDDWKLVKPSDNQCFAQLDRWDGPICSRIQIRECLEASVVEPATKNWHLHFRNHDYWVGTIKLAKFGNCETGLFDLRKPNEAEPNLETMLYFGEHGRIYCFHLLYDTRVRTTIFPMVVSMISNSTIAPNPSATE